MSDILIIDDDTMNLKIAQVILGQKFNVTVRQSGNDGLAYLEEHIPDLILLDIHMPDMDGFEVMEKLQSDSRFKDIPVVFLTADNDGNAEMKGLQAGAQDYVTKPFIAGIMVQRVTRILELDYYRKKLKEEVMKQTEEAECRRQKFERLSKQVLLTLSCTIDAKDKYTNGHSLRVAQYSREIARRAGFSEEEQERIYNVGLLHDIGKIGVPDTIINKPAALTEEEYTAIKSHTFIGAQILTNISDIPDLVTGARWHHERYDGKGYPDGLKGEEIPVYARIIGVADAYDAMTSDRSYRRMLPREMVRKNIVDGKGTQFDPGFADIMLDIMAENIEYRAQDKIEFTLDKK